MNVSKPLLLAAGALIGALAPYAGSRIRDSVVHFDRGLDRAYASLRHGMSRDEVTARMGTGGETIAEFALSQIDGYEFEYAAAARCGATDWLRWRNGVDLSYVVGFDGDGNAVFRAKGSS